MTRRQFDLDALVRPNILSLRPYRCARDDYSSGILLDANENAFGSVVSEAPQSPYSAENLHRYPDPHQAEFRRLYAQFRGLEGSGELDGGLEQRVFMGVGSDEVIDILFRVFCQPNSAHTNGDYGAPQDCVVSCPPTYGMYGVSAAINQVHCLHVPLLAPTFQLDTDKLIGTIESPPPGRQVKMVFLCSPGNPTGVALLTQDMLRVLDSAYKGLVVVDEAYIDFVTTSADAGGRGSMVPWLSKYPNLVVMQTLSKSFGMAGVRCGVALASPGIVRLMNMVKPPYNISTPTSMLARSAMSADAIACLRAKIAAILKQRQLLEKTLLAAPGVAEICGGWDANFLLVRMRDIGPHCTANQVAEQLYRQLADAGVVVRFRGGELHCAGCLRVTVGTADENAQLMELWPRVIHRIMSQ